MYIHWEWKGQLLFLIKEQNNIWNLTQSYETIVIFSVVSVELPMNIGSAPHIDRMSNIYNNSLVRFYHYVFHDLSGKK